jgi:hypothetical protein
LNLRHPFPLGATLLLAAIVGPSALAQNLVCNGGFELPVVADFAPTDVPCWQTSGGQKIEIQNKATGAAFGTLGQQHVELDVNSDSDIYQDIPTVVGQRYRIRFYIANRVGSSSSAYRVLWDDALLGTALRAQDQTTFIRITSEVVATKTVSRIGFQANGPSDSIGDLIDEVTVMPIPAVGSDLGYTYYLPHYAHGGQWTSDISLVNTSPPGYFAASVQKTVYRGDGTILEATQSLTLNPAGSTTLRSPVPPVLSTGWVKIVSSEPLILSIVFRQVIAGRIDQDASVLSREPTTRIVGPYDNTDFTTGFAVANPTAFPMLLNFSFRNAAGAEIGNGVQSLRAQGHTAFTLPDAFTATARTKGSVIITGTYADGTPAPFLPLGLRFSPTGAFTTLPY